VDAECVRRMMEAEQGRLSEVEGDALDRPLDLEELRSVLQKDGRNKAPGRVGIGRAFFTETWEYLKEDWLELFSHMFKERLTIGPVEERSDSVYSENEESNGTAGV
jgi:hypothetical protein